MIKYKSQNQLKFEFFKTEFEAKLDINNRWVKLADQIPWDDLANIYYKDMNENFGSPSKSARLVIGALIIKHKLVLSDEETIKQIEENPYLQYFVGYLEFSTTTPFDPSLFVKIRERLGKNKFDEFNQLIIEKSEEKKRKRNAIKKQLETKKKEKKTDNQKAEYEKNPCETQVKDTLKAESEPITTHSGKLILDATVAEQYIKYPTDIDLLNEARQKAEEIIDKMYLESNLTKKPRTYKLEARKNYLTISKKRNRSQKEIRKAIKKQLGYIGRDLRTIEKMLDSREEKEFPLSHKYQKIYWIIQQLYSQQLEMYIHKTHKCSDRIVSLHQAHVRPIVRGKSSSQTEFGAKLGVGLRDGYATINNLSWDAYDESSDLIKQVETYKKIYGTYPEVVITDRKYGTKENRKFLKGLGIRYSGTSLGRKPKETEENKEILKAEKKRRKQESGIRNQIEGKFGQGKNGYNLNQIRARKINTSESWICSIFFIMNIIQFYKDNIFVLILRILNLVKLLKNNFSYREKYLFKSNISVLFQ